MKSFYRTSTLRGIEQFPILGEDSFPALGRTVLPIGLKAGWRTAMEIDLSMFS
jgi:hypothetical protein